MKVVMFQDDMFVYLQHIVRSYAGAGIDPEEGLALFQLSQALKGAQTVDDVQLKGAQTVDDVQPKPPAPATNEATKQRLS